MKSFTLRSEIFTLNFTLIFQVHCGPQWPHRRPQAAHCARRGHQSGVQERDTDADRRTRGAHGRPQVRSRERRGRERGPRRRHHCRVSRRSTGEVRYVSQRVYFSYYHGTVYNLHSRISVYYRILQPYTMVCQREFLPEAYILLPINLLTSQTASSSFSNTAPTSTRQARVARRRSSHLTAVTPKVCY